MDFDSMVQTMDDTLVATFQRVDPTAGTIEVTLHPSDGSADITLPCIIKNPMMEEDYIPGGQTGTGMLMLFISASAGLEAVRGWTATYGGADYDVLQSDADRCGGIHIRLRARMQPYGT